MSQQPPNTFTDRLKQIAADAAAIPDPELRKAVFDRAAEHEENRRRHLEFIVGKASTLLGVISAAVAVVISVLTYSAGRADEMAARTAEAEARSLEFRKYADEQRRQSDAARIAAAKEFVTLRQTHYLEAIKAAGVLATNPNREDQVWKTAERRFWELYWGELSVVEDKKVEAAMVALGRALQNPQKPRLDSEVIALAHALRDSLVRTWNVDTSTVGETSP